MKILLLADPESSHTKKWVTSLSLKNIQIAVFGLANYPSDLNNEFPGLKIYSGGNNIKSSWLGKLSYLNTLAKLKKAYSEFKPDIVHAHYATSYGLLGRFLNHKPFVISVWGSDVYDFPNRSPIHRIILKHNLSKADVILSTGHNMAKETRKYSTKKISVTPFGVDTEVFTPIEKKKNTEITIGIVKALEDVYGIDYLLHSFKFVIKNNPHINIRLVIAGGGTKDSELKDLAYELGISQMVSFMGRIAHQEVNTVLNQLDIYVALSNSESFGVAILEASSCAIPVVVSDADGFKEVVKHGNTGFIVPKRNPKKAAEAIQKLIDNESLRKRLGNSGREYVLEKYNWEDNVQTMIAIYRELI